MSFLAPGALFGLLLLAIPVVVHLFKPRRVRQTPFSSLRWLHLTQQRMARRIQWHQVLLFLLRVAFLTLLVLALARPLWSPREAASGLDRIILLDASLSMDRRVASRSSPWESAQAAASGFVDQMFPGDRVAIVVAGRDAELFAPWTTQPALYMPRLKETQPAATATNLDGALELCRELAEQRSPDHALEICILSDNQAGSLSPSLVSELAAKFSDLNEDAARIRWFDLSLPAPRNAWLASARLQETPRGMMLRVEAAAVGTAPQSRTLSINGVAGASQTSMPCTITPGEITRLDIPLPATFSRKGSRLALRLEPEDELPQDDVLYVDLDHAASPRLLVVEPDSPAKTGAAEGLAWRAALAALAEVGQGFDAPPSLRTPNTLTAEDIKSADIILLADVPGFTTAQAEALTTAVRQGSGLLMLLGPRVDIETYNRRFTDTLHPDDALLPGALAGVAHASGIADGKATGTPARWHWNERDPLVRGLIDPLIGDLNHVSSSSWFRWKEPLRRGDVAAANFPDGTPALITRNLAAGRVIVLNASGDDRWCDLPRRKSFVPLVDRAMTYLAGAGRRRTFAVGEPLAVALPQSVANDRPKLTGVDASQHSIPWRLDDSSARPLARCNEILPSGFATLERSDGRPITGPVDSAENTTSSDKSNSEAGPIFVTINADRSDGPLKPLNEDALRRWWEPANFQIERLATTGGAPSEADRRIDLEPWLAVAACLCLVAEMFFVHWLCPRINPAVHQAGRRRRGFLAPLREREEVSV